MKRAIKIVDSFSRNCVIIIPCSRANHYRTCSHCLFIRSKWKLGSKEVDGWVEFVGLDHYLLPLLIAFGAGAQYRDERGRSNLGNSELCKDAEIILLFCLILMEHNVPQLVARRPVAHTNGIWGKREYLSGELNFDCIRRLEVTKIANAYFFPGAQITALPSVLVVMVVRRRSEIKC